LGGAYGVFTACGEMISLNNDIPSSRRLTGSYTRDTTTDDHHPEHAFDSGAMSRSGNGNTLRFGLS
jgi:hypothetical protein